MAKKRIRILYLDDEENNLSAFKAGFRRNFEIYTASNALDAYRLLEEIDIHVALADQRMPKVDLRTRIFQLRKMNYDLVQTPPNAIRHRASSVSHSKNNLTEDGLLHHNLWRKSPQITKSAQSARWPWRSTALADYLTQFAQSANVC